MSVAKTNINIELKKRVEERSKKYKYYKSKPCSKSSTSTSISKPPPVIYQFVKVPAGAPFQTISLLETERVEVPVNELPSPSLGLSTYTVPETGTYSLDLVLCYDLVHETVPQGNSFPYVIVIELVVNGTTIQRVFETVNVTGSSADVPDFLPNTLQMNYSHLFQKSDVLEMRVSLFPNFPVPVPPGPNPFLVVLPDTVFQGILTAIPCDPCDSSH